MYNLSESPNFCVFGFGSFWLLGVVLVPPSQYLYQIIF